MAYLKSDDNFKNIGEILAQYDNIDFQKDIIKKAENILKDEYILKMLKKNNLSKDDVYQNPFIFEDVINENKRKNDQNFIFEVEKNNDLLIIVKKPTKKFLEIIENKKHLDNFVINDAENLYYLKLSDLELDKENNLYLGLYNILVDSIKEKKKINGIFIYGDVGIGKTFLMVAYCNELARIGYHVGFAKTSLLVKMLRNFNDDEEIKYRFNKIKNCDFLVLDDFGSEYNSDYVKDEIILPLLDYRMENNLTTCFTSNYDFETLFKIYSDKNKVFDNISAKRFLERIKVLAKPFKLNSFNKRKYK